MGFKNQKTIIVSALFLIVEISMIAILGAYSQIGVVTVDLIKISILGFVPGSVLAASLIIENNKILERHGWKRFEETVNKKAEKIKIPKLIAQWYSVLMVIGPIIAVSQVFFGLSNNALFGYLIIMVLAAKLNQEFLDERFKNNEMVIKTLRVAAISAGIGLPIGILATI
jgi:hypothetical protein